MEIGSNNLKWNGHDLYVVEDREGKTEASVFYAPTLKLALLIKNELAAKLWSGEVPEIIQKKLERQLPIAQNPIIDRPKAFHLALGLTKNCTLGCLYCHAEADKNILTDRRLISRAIDYAFSHAGDTPKKTLTVSFAVGGEPTMNWELFRYAVDRIRELEREGTNGVAKVFLSMTTNGYYGDTKRHYVADNFDTLTLSLDGFAAIQNLHRPTRMGHESYSLVAETCKYLLKSGLVRIGLRGTVSKESVRFLAEIIDHYYEEFGGGYAVAFEPLIQTGRALDNRSLLPPTNEQFAENYWKAKKRGEQFGIRVVTSAANINRLVGRYCGAMSIPSFTVCSDGQITACHRDQDATDYGYGSIDAVSGNVSLDTSRIENNVGQTEMPSYCDSCIAKWHCAGDCPDLRRVGYSRCDVNRFLVLRQLEDLLTQEKGGDKDGELQPGH